VPRLRRPAGEPRYLFFGSDTGGERAAIIYSLIESCRLNKIDPQSYPHYVLERIADHPIIRSTTSKTSSQRAAPGDQAPPLAVIPCMEMCCASYQRP